MIVVVVVVVVLLWGVEEGESREVSHGRDRCHRSHPLVFFLGVVVGWWKG